MQRTYLFFFLTFLFCVNFSYSQSYIEIFADPNLHLDSSKFIMGESYLNSSSNAITSEFFNRFARGFFIDDQEKDRVINRLNEHNKYGLEFDNVISFSDYSGKINFTAFVKQTIFYDIYFTRDIFKTAFLGNAVFAGKTAQLSPFHIRKFNFQQVNFSCGTELNDRINFLAGISFIKGIQHYEGNTGKARLFTAEDGDSLFTETQFEYYETGDGSEPFLATNGLGASINGQFQLQFNKDKKLTFSFYDLGFISWTHKSAYYYTDTSAHFKGLDVATSEEPATKVIDSILNRFDINPESKKYVTEIPAKFFVVYHLPFQFLENTQLQLGAKYIISRDYFPFLQVSLNKTLNDNIGVKLGLVYGGFGDWGINTQIYLYSKGSFYFSAGSYHLNGLIFRNTSTSESAFLKAAFIF